jgi:hypothetical protein
MSFLQKIIFCLFCSLALGTAYYFNVESSFGGHDTKLAVNIEINTDEKIAGRSLNLYIKEGISYRKCKSYELSKSVKRLKYIFDLDKEKFNSRIIRLDFEGFKHTDNIKMEKLELKNKEKTFFALQHERISEKLHNYSENVEVNKNKLYFKNNGKVFDPYILFNVKSIVFFSPILQFFILLPWLVFFAKDIFAWTVERLKKRDFETILITLFLMVLPLKIAWVTFITALLLFTSITKYILSIDKKITLSKQAIVFFFIFLVYLFFGNANDLDDLSLKYSFIMIPLIFMFQKPEFDFNSFYRVYIYIFLILMCLIFINGAIFISLLENNYQINPLQYFINLKMFNAKMMRWLPYSHPTFFPSFCLIGMIFCEKLHSEKLLGKNTFILYSVFSLITIILLGSRLMLFAWVTLTVATLFIKRNEKQRLYFFSTILFIFICSMAFLIKEIDFNRFKLWSISKTAISENLYGYGVDSSREILSNKAFLSKNNINIAPTQNHSHNQFITIFLELGIFGFFLITLSIKYLGYLLYRSLETTFLPIFFLFFMLLITESPFETATPIYFYTFIFCLSSLEKSNKRVLK